MDLLYIFFLGEVCLQWSPMVTGSDQTTKGRRFTSHIMLFSAKEKWIPSPIRSS